MMRKVLFQKVGGYLGPSKIGNRGRMSAGSTYMIRGKDHSNKKSFLKRFLEEIRPLLGGTRKGARDLCDIGNV